MQEKKQLITDSQRNITVHYEYVIYESYEEMILHTSPREMLDAVNQKNKIDARMKAFKGKE